jgi:leucyl/phenylalanyl-tRNA--protein transferase
MTASSVTVHWVNPNEPLPAARTALQTPAQWRGLVAAGHDLSVDRLVEAYSQGIFPWFSQGQPVLWWSPDPRMVLRVSDFRVHDSLRKTLRQFRRNPQCEIRLDSAFGQVIRHCAERPRAGQSGTWIVPEMIETYEALHHAGLAHSVETWVNGELVGGLYLVSIGQALFGESMFALQRDASKIALAALVGFARHHRMGWIDCQQNTSHLASLGAREMPRAEFLRWVERDTAMPAPIATPAWTFDSIYWFELDSKPQDSQATP